MKGPWVQHVRLSGRLLLQRHKIVLNLQALCWSAGSASLPSRFPHHTAARWPYGQVFGFTGDDNTRRGLSRAAAMHPDPPLDQELPPEMASPFHLEVHHLKPSPADLLGVRVQDQSITEVKTMGSGVRRDLGSTFSAATYCHINLSKTPFPHLQSAASCEKICTVFATVP